MPMPEGTSTYASGTDRVVFSMEINDATNSYTFTLFDKIDHALPPANADHQENTRAIDLDGLRDRG